MKNPLRLTITWAGLLSLSFSLHAQGLPQTVEIFPDQVESSKSFQVTLSGKTTLCNPQFSRHEATVSEGSIQLSVVAMNDPLAKCTAGEHDYQTDFQLPAIKADKYTVTAILEPPCRYSIPACLQPDILENGGQLWVQDSASLLFAIRPDRVEMAKPFELNLIRQEWVCGQEIMSQGIEVSDHAIYLSYTERNRIGAICPAIQSERIIPFKMTALTAGTYQVFAMANTYCSLGPQCPQVKMTWLLAGALMVGSGPTSIPSFRSSSQYQKKSQGNVLHIEAGHIVKSRWKGASTNLTGQRK